MSTPIECAKQIQPATVERDEDGYWIHPDFPDWDEDTAEAVAKAWLSEQGLRYACQTFEDELSFEESEARINSETFGCADWTPIPPDGAGWFILSIHDTEDGPVCVWATREPAPEGGV